MSDNGKLLSAQSIAQHNSPTDCWIVVDGQVWDLTEFAPEHPGGAGIILKYAGRDATKPYSEIHAPSVLSENLTPDKHKGTLDTNTVDEEWMKPPPDESQKVVLDHERPPLGTLINAHDFEFVASKTATKKTWAFYSSAATDLITRDANKSMFDRIWFRPRTMRDVTRVNTRSKILGNSVRFPLFVAPAAMAKLMHPDGELAMARACAAKGIMQGISNNASYSMKDICAQAPSHPFFFQLYVNKDRRKSEIQLQQCNEMPNLKAIFVTVDAAAAGKREADERVKADETVSSPMSGAKASNDKQGGGLGRVMGSFIDSALNWSDVAWLRRHTKLPLVLKGVMTAADAKMAMEHGLDGILLSNHGGRNLDMSPPSILVLLELHKQCPEIFDRMEIFVDGGVRRGTDILKCLCLGATAVGIGRTFLYSVNYGQEGVEHLIDILYDELKVAMRLNGITDIAQASPDYINTADVDNLVPSSPGHPYIKWRPKGAIKAKL